MIPYLISFLVLYLIIINAAGFLLMLADKQAARKSAWRIPETVLMRIAFTGGCLGIYLGMMAAAIDGIMSAEALMETL